MNRKITEFLKLPETIRIPYFWGVWYRLFLNIDNRLILKEKIPFDALNKRKRDYLITVSLTSFPKRIDIVHIAIKSLLLQSVKPDRVVLWLAEEQFPDKKLPQKLTRLEKYGLEIIWTKDLYGHKKYFELVKNQKPNELIVTYDDDIIYPIDSIKRLIKTYEKHKNCIICERAQAICYDERGNMVKNPGKWKTISDIGTKEPSFSLNPSPGGGCLIPYKAFHKDATNEELIRKLAYKNDDLWYMFMAAQNGTPTIKTRKYHKSFSSIHGSQTYQMATENVVNDKNQIILEGLISAYPEAWQKITDNKKS